MSQVQTLAKRVIENIERVIVGKRDAVELTVVGPYSEPPAIPPPTGGSGSGGLTGVAGPGPSGNLRPHGAPTGRERRAHCTGKRRRGAGDWWGSD